MPLNRIAETSSSSSFCVVPERVSPMKVVENAPLCSTSIGTIAFPVRSPPMRSASTP
jgi:hypothetical protein